MESTSTPEQALYGKLLKIGQAISRIEKRGRNEHHHYDFVQATDVVAEVRRQLHSKKIIVLPGTVPGSTVHAPAIGGRGMVTTVDLFYRFVDTESGAMVEVPWTATGADVGGDKGIYKAFTGGLKYALMSVFLIVASNDPEYDAVTTTEAVEAAPQRKAASPSAGKDAERPAAPRIPLDRARLIADQAISVNVAETGQDGAFVMGPVLKAKLAELGVEKIGALNVDQAEALEAFLKAEG